MPRPKNFLGQLGEVLACDYLRCKGYRIIETNFVCPEGEIDVVGYKGSRIVFVEVKTRATEAFGHPFEFVSETKQQKIRKAAVAYLRDRPVRSEGLQFDVVGIVLQDGEEARIDHVVGAF